MGTRIIDLSDHVAKHANGRLPLAAPPPRTARLRDWDVDVGSLFFDDRAQRTRHARAGFRVRVDPLRCGYSVTIYRDGIDYPLIVQQFHSPGESRDAAVAREAIAWFIDQCLSAAYKVAS